MVISNSSCDLILFLTISTDLRPYHLPQLTFPSINFPRLSLLLRQIIFIFSTEPMQPACADLEDGRVPWRGWQVLDGVSLRELQPEEPAHDGDIFIWSDCQVYHLDPHQGRQLTGHNSRFNFQ